MTDNNTTQETRAKVLRNLIDTYHRDRLGDYSDTYNEFAAEYLPEAHEDWDGDPIQLKPVPRYASIAEDETYGMIHVFDSLTEALNDQAGIPDSGEYLNVPSGVVDLDSGERIETRRLVITTDQFLNLERVFDDAIEYRRSDDEDEDGENDNNQADEYHNMAAFLGVPNYDAIPTEV